MAFIGHKSNAVVMCHTHNKMTLICTTLSVSFIELSLRNGKRKADVIITLKITLFGKQFSEA